MGGGGGLDLQKSSPEPVDQFQQTWHVELWTRVLQCIYKL